jgi:hypothetical protein
MFEKIKEIFIAICCAGLYAFGVIVGFIWFAFEYIVNEELRRDMRIYMNNEYFMSFDDIMMKHFYGKKS